MKHSRMEKSLSLSEPWGIAVVTFYATEQGRGIVKHSPRQMDTLESHHGD